MLVGKLEPPIVTVVELVAVRLAPVHVHVVSVVSVVLIA